MGTGHGKRLVVESAGRSEDWRGLFLSVWNERNGPRVLFFVMFVVHLMSTRWKV